MSYMKQYADDTEAFTLRAIETAWITDPVLRDRALSRLLDDCKTAATAYHAPAEVMALFVYNVSQVYGLESMAQINSVA